VVVLRIQLLPNGQVKDVQVVQSSGDRAFDLAAEAAVRKVETFKDITDKMKPEELKMFSDFDLKFDPQDLLM
jgi:colicin import membrane protein